jgi:hypothetical protein
VIGEVLMRTFKKIVAAAMAIASIGVTTTLVAAPASAATNATCPDLSPASYNPWCVNFSVVGDLDYAEVKLAGYFKGEAAVALDELVLCDEKTDREVARAAITVAERRQTDGAVRYRSFDFASQGPNAGCGTINPHDQSSPGWFQWAVRADYIYDAFGVETAATGWYHTAWAYNKYLQGWCPTCRTAK